MKNKGLVILTGVVTVVVSYALYDYQAEKYTENKKSTQSTLLKLNKDQINEFQIFQPNIPDIKVQRTTEGWKLVEPISETADQGSIEDFIGATALEKYNDLVKEGDAIDWKIYGLDQPKGIISFKTTQGDVVKFLVSSKNNFSSDPYLKIEGQNKVYTASSTWTARAEKKPFDFRDKRIMRKAAALAQYIKISRGIDKLYIEKKEGSWVATGHADWKLDQTKSGEIIYMLNNTSALDIVKEGVIKTSDLKSYGLTQPQFSVEVGFKDNKKWKANFGKNEKSEYFAKIEEPSLIMKIAIQDLDKLQNLTLAGLRDRREPFNFDKDKIKKIQLNLSDIKVEFEQQGDTWKVKQEDKAYEYQSEKVSSVLSQLRSLEAMDLDAKDFDNTEKLVELKSPDGKNVFELALGANYKKKIDGVEKSLILAKSNLFKNAVGLDEETFKSMGLNDLVKKRRQEDSKK